MKIRMLSRVDGRFDIGDEPVVSDNLAARLIERGYAIPIRDEEVEFAVVVAPETAMKRKRRGKRNVEPS